MTAFVLDNSVTMRWCFKNTSTPYAEEVLEQLLAGQQAHVPVLWLYEVVSVLAKAQRTGSITSDKVHGFLEGVKSLDITVDDESFGNIFGDVHRLAVEHRLSGYDAESRPDRRRRTIPAGVKQLAVVALPDGRGSDGSLSTPDRGTFSHDQFYQVQGDRQA